MAKTIVVPWNVTPYGLVESSRRLSRNSCLTSRVEKFNKNEDIWFLWNVQNMIWYRYICELQLVWHPVAVVQYTFTQTQYIEQQNEMEYSERNIHNKDI
jgi:hypothetical protein